MGEIPTTSRASDNKLICPACLEEDDEDEEPYKLTEETIYPDKAILRELNKQAVKCNNEGCDWKDFFRNYQEHEEECPHFPMACDDCGDRMSRQDLHAHMDGGCEKAVKPCIFSQYGCNVEVNLAQQERHENDSLVIHLKLLHEYVSKLDKTVNSFSNEDMNILSERVRGLGLNQSENKVSRAHNSAEVVGATARDSDFQKEGGTSKNKGSNKGGKKKGKKTVTGDDNIGDNSAANANEALGEQFDSSNLDSLENDVDTLNDVSHVLKRQMEQMNERAATLERQTRLDENEIKSLEQKITVLERQLKGKDQVLSQLTSTLQAAENVSYNGVLTWRITEVARRRREAITGQVVSLFSPPFYTSHTGYKMCARIYLNGDGMGRDSHVSLFFTLMKGTFDPILKWPFQQKVALNILDQNGKQNVTDRFKPDSTTSSFCRPTDNMNVASGCPLFLEIKSLEDPTKGYCKDDVIFVRFEVDTTGLS